MSPLVATLNGWTRRIPVLPLYVVALVPAVWAVFAASDHAEPVKALEHALGKYGLQFLIASLLVTPLMKIWRLNLIRFRRMLGLTAFYYVLLHFLVWLVLDRELAWSLIGEDLTKRPYIIIGMIGLLALLPAAMTSTDYMVRRLEARTWRRLHWWVYPAVAAGAVHYLWLVKSWPLEPILYTLGVALLLAWRVWPVGAMVSPRKRSKSSA